MAAIWITLECRGTFKNLDFVLKDIVYLHGAPKALPMAFYNIAVYYFAFFQVLLFVWNSNTWSCVLYSYC